MSAFDGFRRALAAAAATLAALVVRAASPRPLRWPRTSCRAAWAGSPTSPAASTSRPSSAPRTGWRSSATTRSPAATTCGSAATGGRSSTTAAGRCGWRATPTCTSRAWTTRSSRCSSRRAGSSSASASSSPATRRASTRRTRRSRSPGRASTGSTSAPTARGPSSSCARARRRRASRPASSRCCPARRPSLEGDVPAAASVRNGYYVDGFDAWSAERDRRYDRARSTAYVSRQMIGYPDLDEYGRWETSGEYGALWYPSSVPGDWAPYRYGRWSWVGGWGWTWVDDAPWGYAPFHYGRWVYVGQRWGWAPGGYVARPMWSPAMVGWYGGDGWSFSVSYGAPVYGWVPLGWGEPLVPVVARLLEPLLDDGQPAVCREPRRAAACAAGALRELVRARRRHGGPGRDVRRTAPGPSERRRRAPQCGGHRAGAVAGPALRQARPRQGPGHASRRRHRSPPQRCRRDRCSCRPRWCARARCRSRTAGRRPEAPSARTRGAVRRPSAVPGAAIGAAPVRPAPRAPGRPRNLGTDQPAAPTAGGPGTSVPPSPVPPAPVAVPREPRPAPGTTLQRDVRPAPGGSPSEPRALPPTTGPAPRPEPRMTAPPAVGLGQPSSPGPPASLQRPGVYAPAPASPAGPAPSPRGAPPAPRSAPGAPVVAPPGQAPAPSASPPPASVQPQRPPPVPSDAPGSVRDEPAPRPSPREVPR